MSGLSSNNFKKVEKGLELNVSAPGKVILHGEHSVVYGKLAVAASLGLRTKVHLIEIDSPSVLVFKIFPLDFEYVFNLEEVQNQLLDKPPSIDSSFSDFNWELPKLVNHTSHLKKVDNAVTSLIDLKKNDFTTTQLKSVKCLFYLLLGILSSANVKFNSMYISVDSELDIGAGAGSSASFSVTFAGALIHFLKLKSENVENVSRQGFKPFSWDRTELEMMKTFSDRQLQAISDWAFCAEQIFHGTPSGLDNTICTFGNMLKFRKSEKPNLIKLNTSFNILLINTRVPRETIKLVAHVATLHVKFPALVNHTLDAMDQLTSSAIETILKIDSSQGDSDAIDKDYEDLKTLMHMNHCLLASLGVSHPKLEEINMILEKKGLKGKLTGAGGGGFAISILPPSYDPEEVIRKLKEHGFRVICTKLGGDGVRVD